MEADRLPSSFRDPFGYVFRKDLRIYRRILGRGVADFDQLETSGLARELTEGQLILPYKVVQRSDAEVELLPEQLAFISYPYEWCFSQLKDAALATIEVQERALGCGLSLKDASAFNIQFFRGKPLLIDTSSFELYEEGKPWIAYRQFCEHFLCPLALMSKVSPELGLLRRVHLDGIPVDLAAQILPKKTWFNPWLNLHIKQHAKANSHRSESPKTSNAQIGKSAVLGLLKTLRSAAEGLKWEPQSSTWGDYSSASSYDASAGKAKSEIVATLAAKIPKPKQVWDIGANFGEFSQIFSQQQIFTVAWDGDINAVEKGYASAKDRKDMHLLPLLQDFTNPSPRLGWAHEERMSFSDRGPVDLCLVLAFIHHMAIGNSVPMEMVAEFLHSFARYLIIEFIDEGDARVKQLRSTRKSGHEYNLPAFRSAFDTKFEVLEEVQIPGSERKLFLMKAR